MKTRGFQNIQNRIFLGILLISVIFGMEIAKEGGGKEYCILKSQNLVDKPVLKLMGNNTRNHIESLEKEVILIENCKNTGIINSEGGISVFKSLHLILGIKY